MKVKGYSYKGPGGKGVVPKDDALGPGPEGMGFRGKGTGPGGTCVCPKDGTIIPHGAGMPCQTTPCPKCGNPMYRTFNAEVNNMNKIGELEVKGKFVAAEKLRAEETEVIDEMPMLQAILARYIKKEKAKGVSKVLTLLEILMQKRNPAASKLLALLTKKFNERILRVSGAQTLGRKRNMKTTESIIADLKAIGEEVLARKAKTIAQKKKAPRRDPWGGDAEEERDKTFDKVIRLIEPECKAIQRKLKSYGKWVKWDDIAQEVAHIYDV